MLVSRKAILTQLYNRNGAQHIYWTPYYLYFLFIVVHSIGRHEGKTQALEYRYHET